MKARLLALITFSAFLVGCAGAHIDAMAGLGQLTERDHSFDGTHEISLTPARLPNGKGKSQSSIFLGAKWLSNDSKNVHLELSHRGGVGLIASNAYTGMRLVEIRANNKPLGEYKTTATQHSSSSYNTVTKTIYTKSTAYAEIPFPLFETMLTASDVRLRIHTGDGYVDSIFSVETGAVGTLYAKHYLSQLLLRVKSYISNL